MPFEEYINFNLDMSGVDGISFETVALAMREAVRALSADDNDNLDRLQETLLACMNIEIISRIMHDNTSVTEIDPHALDQIVATTMLLAFSCYNQLAERFGFETPALAQSRDDVQRLWTSLRSASGWVNAAAANGDAVAAGMAREITETLEAITPPDWSNHTRTLPG